MRPLIAVLPRSTPELEEAVRAGGGALGALEEADGVVWTGGDELPVLPERVRWLQLPAAGVERWIAELPDGPVVTSMAGAFAVPVAEHALALILALAHRIPEAARAAEWSGLREGTRTLEGATVAIVGAGGIGRALIGMLAPLGARVLAVTRRGRPVPGADETVPSDGIDDVLPRADVVVLAAPAAPGAPPILDAAHLARLQRHAHVVNIGRGTLVDTDALLTALEGGRLGGAALDVVDPEPLPAGHPLWDRDDVVITPHVGTAPDAELRHAAQRVRDNVARLAANEPLLGVVDKRAGY
jgi:phosphoglycerate dehydrogenase-like enzyme